ncbi:phage tail spike protein [Romboutsia hominis]|uniref:Prophage endopeptidase tail n=1 Tax=Romboutsia hominis TaxID=1507512 RepID=A0A2P2BRJ1_9FIRM|nr:phage tail spike protein [Romboutsia hominis]CEI72922.1 Prophage endopeptidase tail [Romboutsia hominis]
MYPKLYLKDEINFEHNGEGVLRDCISCKVTEEDNGIFELELTYKVNSFLSDEIVNHNIIKAKASEELGEQLFRIYWVSNEIDGTIQVKAQHITYDLRDNFVENVTSTNSTCQQAFNDMLSKCINQHRFKGYSDIEHTATYNLARVNALEAIKGTRGSLADTYGNGAKLIRDNFNIYLNKDRGKNNNVLIAYKKNITGYIREIDESEVVTVIYPFAKIEKQVGEGESIEETIVLPERFIQSKYINNYPHPKVLAIDYSEDEAIKDITTLRNKANKYFSETKKDMPNINYKVEFIDLSKTTNYKDLGLDKLESVGLGDTVIVRDFRIGMNVEARVIKTVFDSLNDKYVYIELGKFKRSLADINNDINSSIENGLDSVRKDMYVNFEVLDDKITSEVSKLDGDIKTHTTLIKQTAESIKQVAKDVEGNTSLIEQTSTSINQTIKNVNKNLQSQISQTSENIMLEVGKKVGEDEVISAINLSPSGIKINAEKVNLYGYVVISDLESNGSVIIHGGNILAGTLACDMLSTPSGHEPVINLFSDHSRNCQIDARNSDGGNKGSAIRLKYDDNNYLFINSNGISAFIGGTQDFVVNEAGVLHKGNYLSKEGHTHNYASSSHNHSGQTINPDTVTCRAFGNGYSILMHSSLDGNGKNLGYSGSRFNQVSANYGYFNNMYNLAIDNPVSTYKDTSLNDVLDSIIIESPNVVCKNFAEEKLLININELKNHPNAKLFTKKHGDLDMINESSLLALALQEIKSLKEEVKLLKESAVI